MRDLKKAEILGSPLFTVPDLSEPAEFGHVDIYYANNSKKKEFHGQTEQNRTVAAQNKGKRSHMIGHGLGVEISEPPVISAGSSAGIFENYVICIEMHLLDVDAGAMKLEDTVLVGRHGNKILTVSSRELGEVRYPYAGLR